jgi:hypothetical protein
MDAKIPVQVNKQVHGKSTVTENKQQAGPREQQGNNVPVMGSRDSGASLLSDARVAQGTALVGSTIMPTSAAAHPATTTTTTTTSTTTTTTTDVMPQPQRISLIGDYDDNREGVWDHYARYAHLIDGLAGYGHSPLAELLRGIGGIKCTLNYLPADDIFIDGFIELVRQQLGSATAVDALEKQRGTWARYQEASLPAQQNEMATWIKLIDVSLMLARALQRTDKQPQGARDPLGRFRKPIDALRNSLVCIYNGGKILDDASVPATSGPRSNKPVAIGQPGPGRGSMPALVPLSSAKIKKKAPARLPEEHASSFDSKQEALHDWARKADKAFSRQHVSTALLDFFAQTLDCSRADWDGHQLVAYKFLASVAFAEWTEGRDIADVLVETVESESGYVNEILIWCQKLKFHATDDAKIPPERRLSYSLWRDFFIEVGSLMDFRRSDRETKFADSPAMFKALTRCEDAYKVLQTMKGYESLRPDRASPSKAGKEKSTRAKQRRLRGRSMDFLFMNKEKKNGEASSSRDTDAIGLSPRKKHTEGIRSQEKTRKDEALVSLHEEPESSSVRNKEKVATPRTAPDADSVATIGPISPRSISKKKKPAQSDLEPRTGNVTPSKGKRDAASKETRSARKEDARGDKPEKGDSKEKSEKKRRKDKSDE